MSELYNLLHPMLCSIVFTFTFYTNVSTFNECIYMHTCNVMYTEYPKKCAETVLSIQRA